MATQDGRAPTTRLVRTSVLLPKEADEALRKLAEAGERPLSWEIRRAVEDHIARQNRKSPATKKEAA